MTRFFFLMVLSTVLAQGQSVEPRPSVKVSFEEKLLGKTTPEMFPPSQSSFLGPRVFISPDGRRMAFIASRDRKFWVGLDNQKGMEFDSVENLVFSPDGRRLAYRGGFAPQRAGTPAARGPGKSLAVVDDKPGESFDGIRNIVFSPDSSRVAYSAELKGKHFIVLDGQRHEMFDQMGSGPFFTPDSQKVFYSAGNGKKAFVVVGEEKKEIPGVDQIFGLVFSPDLQSMLLEARKGDKELMVFGEKRGELFNWVNAPVLSPDGKRVAYEAKAGEKEFIVLDDQKGEAFDIVSMPHFSLDGRSLAYGAISGDKMCVVVDGKKGEEYGIVGGFSREDIAFRPGSGELVFVASENGEEILVSGDKKEKISGSVNSPLFFSPDGKKIAYVMRTLNPQARYQATASVMVGNRKSEEFDVVWPRLVFSLDGKKLAFGALKGDEVWWKVMDVP